MFFAVTGAMGHIPTVMKMAPSLFLHTLIQIIVHFSFSVSVGKLLKLPLREIVLASNANVGGATVVGIHAVSFPSTVHPLLTYCSLHCVSAWCAMRHVPAIPSEHLVSSTHYSINSFKSHIRLSGPTTAAAMASSKKWKELVLPALLTG